MKNEKLVGNSEHLIFSKMWCRISRITSDPVINSLMKSWPCWCS